MSNVLPAPGAPAVPVPDALDDERVSGLVGTHLKRHLGKALEEALGPHLAAFREQLVPKVEPKPEPKGAAGGDPDRFAAIEGELKKEREARAAERQQSHEAQAFADLRAELNGKVRPEAVETVAKLLFHADKAVRVKDGKVSMRFGDDEYHTIAEGVAAYLKSPTAALFKDAPGYAGAKRPGGRVPPRGSDGKPPANEAPLAKARRLIAEASARNGG